MKKKPKATATAKARAVRRAGAKKQTPKSAKKSSAAKTSSAKKKASPTKKSSSAKRSSAAKKSAASSSAKWLKFVEDHGVVLASARGPVPSIAEAVAGEPIVGSWWAHPKGHAIFEVLSAIDDSDDIRCFKLVDGKVTLVHRKAWPALVRLGRDGVIATEQLAAVEQEHMPTGEHRNFVTPFPEWVDDETTAAADALTTEQARAQLAWVEG